MNSSRCFSSGKWKDNEVVLGRKKSSLGWCVWPTHQCGTISPHRWCSNLKCETGLYRALEAPRCLLVLVWSQGIPGRDQRSWMEHNAEGLTVSSSPWNPNSSSATSDKEDGDESVHGILIYKVRGNRKLVTWQTRAQVHYCLLCRVEQVAADRRISMSQVAIS